MLSFRPRLKGKLIGVVGLIIVLGLGGISLLHQHLAVGHHREALQRDLAARVELLVRLMADHHQILQAYRRQEEAEIGRQLERLALSYRELCSRAQALVDEGEQTTAQAKQRVAQLLSGQRIGVSGYPFVWDISLAPEVITLAVHPVIQGRNVADVDFVQRGAAMRQGYMEYFWKNPDEKMPRLKAVALAYFAPWHWVIVASSYKSEFFSLRDQTFYLEAERTLADEVSRVRVGANGYALVVDASGGLVIPPPPEILDPVTPGQLRLAAQPRGTYEVERGGRRFMVSYCGYPEAGWVVVVVADEDELLAPVLEDLRNWTWGAVAALALITILILTPLLDHLVVRPARRLAVMADRIASGDLEASPGETAGSGDEIGDLGQALGHMAQRLKSNMADMARSEKRYRTLFENAPEPGWVVSSGGFIMQVNPAAEEFLGRTAEELVGRHFRTVLAPGNWDKTLEYAKKAYKTREAVGNSELEFLGARGDVRLISGFLSIWQDAIGDVGGFYGMGRDLTEQRALARQLAQAQKMEIVGTLAGGMAHDFNNLLASILGYSSLLLDSRALSERERRWLAIIDESAGRAAALTRQLLDFAKGGETGRAPFGVNAMVEEALTILERSFRHRVNLDRRLSPEELTVLGDAGQLHQALMNVCINARDAMPDGGRLTVRTDREAGGGRRALGGEPLPDEVVAVEVTDTGAGMDEATLSHAMEPFFTTKAEGTGLGLAMVYGIIKRHQGLVEITSWPDRGTTVRLILPAVEAEPSDQREGPRQRAAGGSETVLVVDDEQSVREMAGEVLSAAGYQVLTAAGGLEALAVLADVGARQVDLVLLDVVMPGMDGRATLAEIKRRLPSLKVMLTSGLQDITPELEEGPARADGFLPKPYRARDLMAKVRNMLDD